MYLLARAVRMATAVVVALIVAGILIRVLDVGTSNEIVSLVDDAAKWLARPFRDVFHPEGEDARIVANWGLAAVVYALAGGLLSRLLARSAGRRRFSPWAAARARMRRRG